MSELPEATNYEMLANDELSGVNIIQLRGQLDQRVMHLVQCLRSNPNPKMPEFLESLTNIADDILIAKPALLSQGIRNLTRLISSANGLLNPCEDTVSSFLEDLDRIRLRLSYVIPDELNKTRQGKHIENPDVSQEMIQIINDLYASVNSNLFEKGKLLNRLKERTIYIEGMTDVKTILQYLKRIRKVINRILNSNIVLNPQSLQNHLDQVNLRIHELENPTDEES